MSTTIKLRRGTAAAWSAANPVLAQGEMGLELSTSRLKIGDGTTAWNALQYGPKVECRSIVLCAAFTPASTGADAAEIVIPYDIDGTVLTFTLQRVTLRVQTAGGAPAITIEKSGGSGVFTPVSIGSVSLSSGAYEGVQLSALGFVASGDKMRFNVTAAGTAQNWTVVVEVSNP